MFLISLKDIKKNYFFTLFLIFLSEIDYYSQIYVNVEYEVIYCAPFHLPP